VWQLECCLGNFTTKQIEPLWHLFHGTLQASKDTTMTTDQCGLVASIAVAAPTSNRFLHCSDDQQG